MAHDNAPDWAAIRAAYEGDGSLSVRAIAKKFGLSHTAIHKRAAAESWAKADGEGGQKGGNLRVNSTPRVFFPPPNGADAPSEGLLERARREAETLLFELEETRRRLDEIEDAIEDETQRDLNGRRRSMMMKAVSLPSRSAVLRTIMQALSAMKDAEPGKKEKAQEKAKAVAGRFSPSPPPLRLVNNE